MKPQIVSEEDALKIANPFLQKLCRSNWHFIEYDDRLVELQYLFICAWRQLPTNTGHFLQDFERVSRPYMDKLNRQAGLRYFRHRSMDAALSCEKNSNVTSKQPFTLHQILSVSEDISADWVTAFLEELPERDRRILTARLDGCSKGAIARQYGLNVYQLDRLLESLGQRYASRYGV